MCGITGWVSFDRNLREERGTLDIMTGTMACRGPDAAGVWMDGHAALGHRRLAVIDPAGGVQPMTADTPGGPVTLTFSGEAYNYRELRRELRDRGHDFATDSDTEVVLHGYLEWGTGVADHLNGMYAFAIWDGRVQTLVMIRDRMGVKPLFAYRTQDGVIFGSEPKAILANPLVSGVVDGGGLRELLSFSKTPGHAVWAGMREVRPGTIVSVDRVGRHERTYWRLEVAEHRDDYRKTVERVRELLEDIVTRQLVSDVPICVLLSGGLDSSAITALAGGTFARQGRDLRSYAVDLVGRADGFVADSLRGTLDAPYAHEVAMHVGTEHSTVLIDAEDLADPQLRRTTVLAKDRPIGFDDMDTSLYLLFKAVRGQSTVALSGESADEVFGGHRWFHDARVLEAETFPWVAAPTRWRLDEDDPALCSSWYLREDVRTSLRLADYVQDTYATALAEIPNPDEANGKERRMREVCYLYLTRFLRLLLDRKDRMSMAVGLEVRVPFCDHRLVEYVFNAPWTMKCFDGREKSILRAAVVDLLPDAIAQRVKSPYPTIRSPRYLRALREQVLDLVACPSNQVFDLFDYRRLVEAMRRFGDEVPPALRLTFERILDAAAWLDIRRPLIRIS